jgi:preprotein translocase subunit Sec63
LKATKIPRAVHMKRTMMMNRKNQKMKKKVIVNIPTKMNMTKSIEANAKQNRIEDDHEDECKHECEYEDEDEHECECEDEHEHECEDTKSFTMF